MCFSLRFSERKWENKRCTLNGQLQCPRGLTCVILKSLGQWGRKFDSRSWHGYSLRQPHYSSRVALCTAIAMGRLPVQGVLPIIIWLTGSASNPNWNTSKGVILKSQRFNRKWWHEKVYTEINSRSKPEKLDDFLWNFRFSRRREWRCLSSGTLRRIV